MTTPPNATVHMVIDDDAVRDSLKILLESHGYAVEDYSSTDAFLTRGRGGPLDCLLLDLHIPVTAGLSALSALLARGIHLPSILITGRVGKVSDSDARRAGATALLEKPIDEGALLATISRTMPHRELPAEHS